MELNDVDIDTCRKSYNNYPDYTLIYSGKGKYYMVNGRVGLLIKYIYEIEI